MVLIKSPLKPKLLSVLGSVFVELICGRDNAVRAAKVKQGCPVQVRSFKNLFPHELSLSVDGEDEVLSLFASAGAAADNLAPIPLQQSPSDEEGLVWFCPICKAPQ